MSVAVARSSSSFSSSSAMSLARRRISSYAPSVQLGPGGVGVVASRSLSRSFSSSSSAAAGSSASWMAALSGETSVVGDEKLTMQNLNDRLAAYLQKVRSLESSNTKLEMQIREFYEKRAPTASKDYAGFFVTISDLRAQILQKFLDNQRIILQIDNAQMAADDFKIKYETELNMSNSVMSDISQLRGVRDGLTLTVTDLEGQLEGLKEELVFIKKTHEEDMSQLRIQSSGSVNVEVDTAESINLQKILEETREQYEAMMLKNTKELEQWFQTKVASLQTEITTRTTEVNTFTSELSELKRTYQNLEISRQSIIAEHQCLQQSLEEVNARYGVQLSQLQVTITTLETELQELRLTMEKLQTDYNILLDIKMRLELEIAEYRRLLEGEYTERKKVEVVVVKEVEETVEEHKPHIEKRVRTIVEELVDGRVVSVSDDVKVESIQ
ncbi:keratin, type I cytoskeletal 19-like [Salarias fasciatus]|uniref:Keratin, type I cytoskeletal 19-like n=1 Tax=Salarias fasciatus TaxID=181472 RepID=A0A672G3G3_SALFA|nr:keratin, type I cytoskeletal 19-like [Salarias fasciatus]